MDRRPAATPGPAGAASAVAAGPATARPADAATVAPLRRSGSERAAASQRLSPATSTRPAAEPADDGASTFVGDDDPRIAASHASFVATGPATRERGRAMKGADMLRR
ncbi:hypothetical protein [Microbacterium yannicii]|uniref:hypothetical protein n=1 Tax=Microbacterium yannicii TaxID=671622 RepID=UPI001888013F|nr:hypothetical protein [Microbacterium yannicii]MCO5954989.1 hypothetical protein [Microbacterium yannicii]